MSDTVSHLFEACLELDFGWLTTANIVRSGTLELKRFLDVFFGLHLHILTLFNFCTCPFALLRSVMLLIIIIYMFGILLCDGVSDYINIEVSGRLFCVLPVFIAGRFHVSMPVSQERCGHIHSI